MSFYVVFKGDNQGVYDSCTHCLSTLSCCNADNYQVYNTHDAAVLAWENLCIANGSSNQDFHDGLLHTSKMVNMGTKNKGSCSGENKHAEGDTNNQNGNSEEEKLAWEKIHMDVTCYAENSKNTKWMIQHNMQEELKYACKTIGIKSPIYTKEAIRVRKGVPYVRYTVSLYGMCAYDEPLLCYGRFARQSNDAKEDAAVVGLRRLLDTTGHKIRDFNYYNVKILEQKIQVLEAEKITMTNVIRTLNEEIEIILPESK